MFHTRESSKDAAGQLNEPVTVAKSRLRSLSRGTVAALLCSRAQGLGYLPIRRMSAGQNHAATAAMTTQNQNQNLRVSLTKVRCCKIPISQATGNDRRGARARRK
jgi:hypothetical protein